MKIYFVHSSHHEGLLREERCKVIITFARVRRVLDTDEYYRFKPYLPGGYPEILVDSGGFQLQRGDVQTTMRINTEEYSRWLKDAIVKYPEIVGYMNLDLVQLPKSEPWVRCKKCKAEEKLEAELRKKFQEKLKCKVCGETTKIVRKPATETLDQKTKRMELSAIITLENQFIMEQNGLRPIPVWHDGEPEEYLSLYCRNYEWVAIGGLVGRLKSKDYYRKLVNRITQNYPDNKIHLLGIGITGIDAFRQGKIYSVDFSTWSTVARYGHIIVTDPKQLIKEIKLPDEDRERLRHDQQFQIDITRKSIKNIQMFEETISNMKIDSYQHILRLEK